MQTARALSRFRSSFGSSETLLSLYLPAFVLATGVGIAIPALPLYAKSFQVDFGMASLVIIANQLGSAVSTVPSGFMIDRFGGRRMTVLGPLLAAAASLMMAAAHSFPELLVYRFIEGCGMQMWMLARLDIITAEAGNKRGTQITGMFSFDGAGRLVGPAIGGFVAGAWGLRAPFVLYGIVALLATVPSVVYLRARGPRAAEPPPVARPAGTAAEPERSGWSAVREILTVPLMVLLVGQFLASATRGCLFAGSLDLYTVYAYGIGPQTLGVLGAVSGALGLPLTWASGRVMDRFGRRATLVPGFSLLTVALGALTTSALAHWSFSPFVGGYLFTKMTMSTTSGSMQVVSSDFAPQRGRGTFFGVWQLVGQTGLLVSPALFALMSESISYASAFASLGLMSAATAFILWRQIKRLSQTLKPLPAASSLQVAG